jgi:formate hydrogenlyase transcriptional activator
MKSEIISPFINVDLSTRLMAIASLFEGDFFVDWVQEIAEVKTRQALAVIEDNIEKGILKKTASGCFRFIKQDQRQDFAKYLDEDDIQKYHQNITSILLGEILDEKEAAIKVSPHLLKTVCNIEDCHWLYKAGELHRRNSCHTRAISCYKKVITELERTNTSEADWLFVETVIGYSKISEVSENFKSVISSLKRAKKKATRRKDKIQLSLLEMHLAKNEWLSSNYDEALIHFEAGLSLSELINNQRLKRATTVFRTFFTYWKGHFKAVVENYEAYVPEVEKHPTGQFPLMAVEAIAVGYVAVGQVTQGLGMLDVVLNSSKNSGGEFVASYAGAYISSIMFEFSRFEEAIKYHKEALQHANLYPNHLMRISLLLLGAAIYFRKNEPKKAIKYLEQFLEKKIDPVIVCVFFPFYLELCWAIESGELPSINGLSPRNEIKRSITQKNIFIKGVGYRYQALLERNEGQPQEKILETLQLSLKHLEESGHRLEQAKTRIMLAQNYIEGKQDQLAKEAISAITPEIHTYGENLIPKELRFLVKNLRLEKDLLKEIMNLSKEIVSIRDNKELVSHIISTTNRLTGAERGAIFLFKAQASPLELELKAAKNLSVDDITNPEFESSLKTIQQAGDTGKGLIYTSDIKGTQFDSDKNIIRSCLAIPMKLRDKVVGVLYHDNRLFANTFQKSDLEILEYFLVLATITMDNIRAYEEIHGLYNKLSEEKQYYEEQQLESLHFEEFVGKSYSIKKVFANIDQVAGTDANVLILGETGVGKELVARAIHRQSPRRDKAFIRVNCNAMPDTLVTSELFGHEKGAFTGAVNRKIGRFELAGGGTLFLDEIGDISLDVQVRLLRVLQSKEFERVGGQKTIRSDFRLLAATNRDLKKMVMEKTFREDLFYRLNVFPIYVPPLSERQGDVAALAQHFLKMHSKKIGKSTKKISTKNMQILQTYRWPGNVRELENVIERGVILSRNEWFQLPKLNESTPGNQISEKRPTLEEMERQYILEALEETDWKIRGKRGTAEVLGIHPSTLYSRIKKLKISKKRTPPANGNLL